MSWFPIEISPSSSVRGVARVCVMLFMLLCVLLHPSRVALLAALVCVSTVFPGLEAYSGNQQLHCCGW